MLQVGEAEDVGEVEEGDGDDYTTTKADSIEKQTYIQRIINKFSGNNGN